MLNLNCINFCQCCSSNRACISCIHQSLKRFSTSRRTVCSFCCSFCPDQIELGYTHIRNVICQISFIPVPLICGDTGLIHILTSSNWCSLLAVEGRQLPAIPSIVTLVLEMQHLLCRHLRYPLR